MFRFLVSFLFLLLSASSAFSATGRVGVLVDGKYDYQIVELEPSSTGKSLSNDWIKFKSIPKDLVADTDGCFCFSETDPRFSFVQAYYHGTKQLQIFDEELASQGLPPLKKVVVTMKKLTPDLAPGGLTFAGAITYNYSPTVPIDITLFAHEVGHVLHLSFAKDIYYFHTQAENMQIIGVREGMANILSALFTGESRIGLLSYGDGLRDVDRFFHYPDQIFTIGDDIARVRDSKFLRETYPVAYADDRHSPVLKLNPDLPEPYGTSSVFTQPLWLASQIFGKAVILSLIVREIHKSGLERSYKKVALDLIRASGEMENRALTAFLAQEFHDRGLY